MFSGWEVRNNDLSLVKQIQCGLNHRIRQAKAFLVCQHHRFRSGGVGDVTVIVVTAMVAGKLDG